MTNNKPPTTKILLIDDDPIFRLGLISALERFPDLQVVAEVDGGADAIARLDSLRRFNGVDLVVLELLFGWTNSNSLSGLSLCQEIKANYPELPILLLATVSESAQLVAAKELGIEGYCPKGCGIAIIVEAIRQLRGGKFYWQMLPTPPPGITFTVPPPKWYHQLRQSGLRQIVGSLAEVNSQLENCHGSSLDWLFWSGRRRELMVARWLVSQLLPIDDENNPLLVVSNQPPGIRRDNQKQLNNKQQTTNNKQQTTNSKQLTTNNSSPLQNVTFTYYSSLENLTNIPLEIDILQLDKKRDLLYIVRQKFEKMLEDLRLAQLTIEQLTQKRSRLLQDLWQVSLTDFFGKYYTLPIGNQDLEIVNILLQDAVLVQPAILDKIPLVVELLANRLFDAPLTIDNVAYSAGTPEAIERGEILEQNLIVQVANAVIQPLLNRFADRELIKESFYDRSLISSREIARFRNNLSWKYRRYSLVDEPIAIFESRYDLFVISDMGIKKISIYSPRRQELEQLRGIGLAVTIASEFRDAIAPRLQGIVAWLGKGIVYVLTQVLGRGIGLIVRGIIQGVGSALQETRFGRGTERGK
ncbi:DUF3685 domain-containing protein [Limnofasciculus baicalensis]|uniref:DUF3685 domain-containing protein n=1 Tax=Limnofasciculus baicalensis BBK-W-15 TaxID=2699891 RepID=A0AAE3GQU7_9CYAN|nr:DUF3685 domain-containing protein [Limnofasciculus baicalensis]MCP2728529.1 DUF3685 domain-containing protein [Limnofasciculus baicalensis BBK-W-15]